MEPLMWMECGVASRAAPGAFVSGDLQVVLPCAERTLLAVLDGLGHGEDAASAALAAARIIEAHPDDPLSLLFERCHQGLQGGRGVVMSAAVVHADGRMEWMGVGNVEAVLFRADPAASPQRETLSTRGGVLGFRLPPLKLNTLSVDPGDTVVLASDGVDPDFASMRPQVVTPQDVADRVLERWGKSNDDAIVLVARVMGA